MCLLVTMWLHCSTSSSQWASSTVQRPNPSDNQQLTSATVQVVCQVTSEISLLLLLLQHPFNGLLSRTTWVSWYQKGKTSRDLNDARDDGVLGCSGISWTICKQSAPRSRQITIPTPHHPIFLDRILFLTPSQQCQSTEGTHSETWSR